MTMVSVRHLRGTWTGGELGLLGSLRSGNSLRSATMPFGVRFPSILWVVQQACSVSEGKTIDPNIL